MNRALYTTMLLAGVAVHPLTAQGTSILVAGGSMQYDAADDSWNPLAGLGVVQPLSGHFRVGAIGTYTFVGAEGNRPTNAYFVTTPDEKITRATAFLEYDIATSAQGGLNRPAIYLRAGIGVVHVAGRPDYAATSGLTKLNTSQRTGSSETLGLGFRVPVVRRVGLQLGVDYDADHALGSHALRDLTSAAALVITP